MKEDFFLTLVPKFSPCSLMLTEPESLIFNRSGRFRYLCYQQFWTTGQAFLYILIMFYWNNTCIYVKRTHAYIETVVRMSLLSRWTGGERTEEFHEGIMVEIEKRLFRTGAVIRNAGQIICRNRCGCPFPFCSRKHWMHTGAFQWICCGWRNA